MAPIFARLGVKLVTRNISQGGLGTLQNAIAAGSLYGDKIDILIWDSGMTEKMFKSHIDLFFRQGLLSGDHVPVIWSAGGQFDLLKMLHEEADADVGEFGTGMMGVEATESDDQAGRLPWAVQYLKCAPEHQDVCKQHDDYCAKCWVPRDDGIEPEQKQNEKFGGQVGWHPGWRQHQLTGRVIAFSVLEALQQAVQQFSEGTMGGPPLADEYWHVSDYFKNIQDKVRNLDPSKGWCYQIKDAENSMPARLCNTAMKGRTHYTPRFNFNETGINSIVKPTEDGYVPKNDKEPLYEGPDAHNECFDIPPGEVDVLSIVSGRRRRSLQESPFNSTTPTAANLPRKPLKKRTKDTKERSPSFDKEVVAQPSFEVQKHRGLDEIKVGKGWELAGEPEGYCDGSYYAVCNRWTHSECVLSGHHDHRGALVGNALSGWLVMTLPAVQAGIIMIKVHTWSNKEENKITEDWSTENNERRLKQDSVERYPENFKFQYAINGKVTSMTKAEFIEKRQKVQRVVEMFTLMDDPNFAKEPVDVEVAIRLQDCGRDCTIGLSHIYWA